MKVSEAVSILSTMAPDAEVAMFSFDGGYIVPIKSITPIQGGVLIDDDEMDPEIAKHLSIDFVPEFELADEETLSKSQLVKEHAEANGIPLIEFELADEEPPCIPPKCDGCECAGGCCGRCIVEEV